METSYSIIQKESEYRILLTPANLASLSANVLKMLAAFTTTRCSLYYDPLQPSLRPVAAFTTTRRSLWNEAKQPLEQVITAFRTGRNSLQNDP